MTMFRATDTRLRNTVLITLHGGFVNAIFAPIVRTSGRKKGNQTDPLILIPLLLAHDFLPTS
jgi:hypothetical protein